MKKIKLLLCMIVCIFALSACSKGTDVTPEYSLGEKLASAAGNTLFGIATVAIILSLMVGVISCFRFIPMLEAKYAVWAEKRAKQRAEKKALKQKAKEQKRRAKLGLPPVEEAQEAKAETASAAVNPAPENLVDDLELVAVITAAIAAMEGVPADGLVVRSIRRSPKNKWNRA